MSDYNNNGWGSCFGGFGGFGFDAIILLLFFGLMGGGMWGGLGGFGAGGGALGMSSLTAVETAQMMQQDNLRATASNTNAKLDWATNIISSNAAKIEGVKDAVTNGFFAEQTQLCQLGNNLNNAIRDNREASAREFCELRHQMQVDKCETLQAISASESKILGVMQAEKIAALEARNMELKGLLSQNAQTAELKALIQAGQSGCNPCGTGCNPCGGNFLCALNTAYAQGLADKIINPTTTAAATA